MKKRLRKAMPHVPLLELRPELREQDEENDDADDPETRQDTADDNDQSNEGANAAEMGANCAFNNSAECVIEEDFNDDRPLV